MTKQDFLEAMGEIDLEYVREAYEYKPKPKIQPFVK